MSLHPLKAHALVRLLRRVEEFRTAAFIARRLHLSQAALFERLLAGEALVGQPLVRLSGESLELTAAARALLASSDGPAQSVRRRSARAASATAARMRT